MRIDSMQRAALIQAPGPRPLPLLGNVLRFGGNKNILFHFVDLWREYGDMAHVRLGPLHVYVVAEPENVHHVLVKNADNYIKGNGYTGFRLLVGQGLVTSDGDLWRRQRRLMQPSFTPRATGHFYPMMVETVAAMLARWQTAAHTGSSLHVDDEMAHLTMSIISKAIFGVDLGQAAREVSDAFHAAFAFVTARTMSAVALPLHWPLPAHRHFQQNLDLIDRFVANQIRLSRTQPEANTLLSLLLQATDDETGVPMNEQQVRDEVVTLFLAGFETTARSLTWGWYLLSRHPQVMAQMVEEVDRVLDGCVPSVADLYHLTYTRRMVDEVLRLYPPTALLGRQTVADDVIGGYPIPAGAIVMLVPFLTHRHPAVWADPDCFDPDRFHPDVAAMRPKSAYIPFITGPRVCLGNNFALMEMVLTFAMTAARFAITRTTDAELGYGFRGSICPSESLWLRIHQRT